MRNVKRWLQRFISPSTRRPNQASTAIDIEKTINDALIAAGLKSSDIGPSTNAESVVAAKSTAAEPVPVETSRASTRVEPARPAPVPSRPQQARVLPARDERHEYTNAAGTRGYSVHVPPGHEATAGKRSALLVMLHGCTQGIADFAAGTRMNTLADRDGFIVVYPEQSARANHNLCWNWFKPADQQHGKGEPSLIAGIASEVMARENTDPRRTYIAGLSAGGAMAVIVGNAYPEIFSAVASHSGLRLGAAHDVASAFTAMKSGPMGDSPLRASRITPTFVIQGDTDTVVAQANGDAIIADILSSASRAGEVLAPTTTTIAQPGRKPVQQTIYRNPSGRAVAEYWVVQGGAHAWAGGDAAGTYTDTRGPDASEAMLDFFARHAAGSIR